MTLVIHTDPQEIKTKEKKHWIEYVNYLFNPMVLANEVQNSPFRSYPVIKVKGEGNNQKFQFAILKSGSNLELNLVSYHKEKEGTTIDLNGGGDSIVLKNCKV